MSCREKEIADLMPWYVNNTLSAEEKMTFEKHLKTCAECQATLLDVQQFSVNLDEMSEVLFSEHICNLNNYFS